MLTISDEVQTALQKNLPVVALESTVIAHGLPRPLNLRIAKRLQQIVKDNGATPATIAVLDGKLCVGLNEQQLQYLASSDDIKKISMRDLSIAVARGWNGATTVASTAWIAHRAGIKVFATGGIGGVHRGPLPDISADLPVLAAIPIVVVCSGAKIVLDLPATREWLETHGITVVGYQCDEMPAFYSRRSGLPVDVRVDGPTEVAEIFAAQRALQTTNSLLVTVPVPVDAEVPAESVESMLEVAMSKAQAGKIGGRDLTPYLLSQLVTLSDGATLRANLALLENNARVAADVARELS